MRLFATLLLVAPIFAADTARKPILGTVTEFRMEQLEIGVKPDDGKAVRFKISPDTQVFRIPPGQRDLDRARPAEITDLSLGDRVLVSFVAGLTEARRIVQVTSSDIAKRDEAERQDWQKRGISGVVASKTGNEVTIESRTPTTVRTTTLVITGKTIVRRYAPDSVKFTEAEISNVDQMSRGDQIRARGDKSEDGLSLTAQDVVFGTFLTKLGSVNSIDREAGQIVIDDLATNKPLTIKLTADTQVKKLPEMKLMAMPAGGHGAPPAETMDMAKMLERLPPGKIDDLKVGGMIVVTSTRGRTADQVTAIMLITNADSFVKMAKMQAEAAGKSVGMMEAISRMHGGMMSGPGGLNLPALIP